MPKRVDPGTAIAAMRAAGVEPLEPYTSTKTPWRCQCLTCDRTVTPRLGNVQSGQGACGYCAGRFVDQAARVETMREAGVEPMEPYPGTNAPWRCRCSACGTVVSPSYSNVSRGSGPCIVCAGNVVDPEVAAETMRHAGAEPLEPYKSGKSPWPSRCLTCGRTVTPLYINVRRGHNPCAFCAGTKVDPDEATRAMRNAGLEPLQPYTNAGAPWPSKCLKCDNEVSPSWSTVQAGGGCKYCAGNVPIDPDKAIEDMIAAGVEPLEPYTSNHTPWRCKCLTCGRVVTPSRANATHIQGWGACRYCAVTGYDPTKPGEVYLVVNHDLGAIKVGITTAEYTDRVAGHERNGWRAVNVWQFDDGAEALVVEEYVLAAWSDLERGVEADAMPQGGHTETVRLADVSEADAIAAVEEAIAAAGE